MATSIEKKIDLLEQLADEDVQVIDDMYLDDPKVVRSFFYSLAEEVNLQAMFLQKLNPTDLARYCDLDIIQDEALVYVFLHGEFPISKMVSILRKLPFDSRKFVLQGLKTGEFSPISELEKQLDAHYGMVEGVFFKDISDSVGPTMLSKLRNSLREPDSSLDAFKQYLLAAARDEAQYLKNAKRLIEAHRQVAQDAKKSIANKAEFAVILKLVYLLGLNDKSARHFEPVLTTLKSRLLTHLLAYKDGKSVGTVLEQFPESIIVEILQTILNYLKTRDKPLVKKAASIKSHLEKMCRDGQVPKIKKAIRRHHLGFKIKEVSRGQ